jgi:hypothetical protein
MFKDRRRIGRGSAHFTRWTMLVSLAVLLVSDAAVDATDAAFAGSSLSSAHWAATGCPNVIFIGARGSGEQLESSSHGLGDAVNVMASTMKTSLGAHGLVVRAFADAVWAGHVHKYLRSISTGVADASSAAADVGLRFSS